ncbi:MAG: hypothetical protein J1F67_08230 [Muribaculaceae bacterium]|nr:hypothetical protein [Muribaculaceae bacterium]
MKQIILYILTVFCYSTCFALPARQGVLQALQPDGTTVNIRMEGNGEHKRIFSEDGYLLTTDSLGFYVYADIITFSVEECQTADVQIVSPVSEFISIEGKTVKCGNVTIDIYKLNGTKITTLKNTTIDLDSGIYLAVCEDGAFKFLIP